MIAKQKFTRPMVVCAILIVVLLPLLIWKAWGSLSFQSKVAISLFISTPSVQKPHPSIREIKVHNWNSFVKWTQENVYCATDYMSQVQDTKFLTRVKRMGVEVGSPPEGQPDETWELPHPVKIFGFEGSTLHFWGDSGGEFEVLVNAPVEHVVQSMTFPRNFVFQG